MSSTAVAAQQGFTQLLATALEGEEPHVSFAGTAKLPKTTEVVWVLPVRDYSKTPGEQFDVETYDLAVRFEVFRPGETGGGAADTRRWALIDLAESELKRVDFHGFRTKGGDVVVRDQSLDPYDKGWVAVSVVTFTCENWLKP